MYTVRDEIKKNENFIEENKADLAASLQSTIVSILTEKLSKAIDKYHPRHITLGGGVSANSGVREAVKNLGLREGIVTWLPALKYTTDNAAMVATAGYFKLLNKEFSTLDKAPYAKLN